MIPLKTLGRWLRPGLLLSLLVMLTGCDAVAILSPKGQIGQDEKTLLITATVLMLLVVIPVIIMTLTFAWKYRASNTKARYEPKWSHSTAIEVVVWSIPCMIVLVLAVLTWRSSHALDPYRPLDSDVKPVTIEAISLDWKWLFIYPEEKVAVVNEIKFPVNTPLNFKITSDSVMNAFFIPHLGSMIYSMAAMETKLHLIANETGEFRACPRTTAARASPRCTSPPTRSPMPNTASGWTRSAPVSRPWTRPRSRRWVKHATPSGIRSPTSARPKKACSTGSSPSTWATTSITA
jgi:cytochrome o ubiquinol oxidase subunit 2